MKKIALISAIALSGLIFNTANAQIHIGFGIHINTPAVRIVASTPVYTDYTPADDYYYLPDVGAYYSVPEKCYYYNNGDNWVTTTYLPGEYRNYDWRSARHYEVRAHRPYLNADVYREKYRGNVYNWSRYNNDRKYYARDEHKDNNQRFEKRNDDHRQQNWPSRQDNNDNRQQNRNNGNQSRNDNHKGGNDNRQRDNNSNEHFADYHGQNGHDRFRS